MSAIPQIVEGREGYWHYHWSTDTNGLVALCGRKTMASALPANAWGTVTHLNERYCKTCDEMRMKR